jgi:hypothetical protein
MLLLSRSWDWQPTKEYSLQTFSTYKPNQIKLDLRTDVKKKIRRLPDFSKRLIGRIIQFTASACSLPGRQPAWNNPIRCRTS